MILNLFRISYFVLRIFKKRSASDPRNDRLGFTLVEITLVVGILVVLSAIVLVTLNIRGNRANVHNVQRKMDMETIQKALDLRAQETGESLPTGLFGGLSERCVGTSSDAFNLSQISWTKNPSDADIKFDVRSCDDASCVGETWPGTPAFSGSPATLNITNAPYFQYKATFNPSITPWPQTTDAHFNAGTNAGTTVSNNSVKLSPNGGTGTNGAMVYCDTSGTTFDGSNCTYFSGTSYNLPAGTYNFSEFKIEDGVTVTLSGSSPLRLNVDGNVKIGVGATLQANGGNGGNGLTNWGGGGGGGGGGAGASNTGNGSSGTASYGTASTASGLGGGGGGIGTFDATYDYGTGGGGGGFGGVGGVGQPRGATSGGSVVGTYSMGDIVGGSGGGGGAMSGGGGGGGGGAIKLISSGTVTIDSTGKITANGGDGGKGWRYSTVSDILSGNGGGGSGGAVYIESASIVNNNTTNGIQANGGSGATVCAYDGAGGCYDGGKGGGGSIELHALTTPSTTGATCIAGTSGNGTPGACTPVANTTISTYLSSGTYTSAIKEVGTGTNFSTVSWAETLNGLLPSNTPIKIKVRTCDDSVCSGEPAFSSITATACTEGAANGCTIDNGGNLTALSSVTNGHGWVQYELTLSNGGDTAKTPSLDSITINYYSFDARPILKDATINGTAQLIGDQRIFKYTAYNYFSPGSDINPANSLIITGSANPNDEDAGTIEYFTGSPPITYTSSIFSGSCYNLTTDLAPLYVGSIPKDPKTGTDANTGYLISVDPATKVVCVKAPGAENDEIIENCRK